MPTAKDIRVAPIGSRDARRLVRREHYSGKVVNNSQLHLGVFLHDKLEGAMQFGPSMDKRRTQRLVKGTEWNEFLELNRMAFSEALPRNSESRAISVAFKLLRKHYPHVKWVISFADAAQCGDGTIYRAAGFVLTGIKENRSILELPDGYRFSGPSVAAQGPKGRAKVKAEVQRRISQTTITKGKHVLGNGGASLKQYLDAGAKWVPGYQFRYVYFLDPTYRKRLTVPEIPYADIPSECRMYRGVRASEAGHSPNPG